MAAPNGFMRGSLAYMLYRSAEMLRVGVERDLRKRGFTLLKFRILGVLHDTGSGQISQLARLCMAEQPATSRAVGTLSRQGLVTSARDARDLRHSVVTLTAKGEALAEELLAMATEREREALARFPLLDSAEVRAAVLSVVEAEL